jgi:hypothetical protein
MINLAICSDHLEEVVVAEKMVARSRRRVDLSRSNSFEQVQIKKKVNHEKKKLVV